MKSRVIKSVLLVLVLVAFSCDEPETIVTNIVHPDGSVTRRIEMRNKKDNFKVSDIQVPYDSTWITKDTLEISEKNDTTWIKRAEKTFKNVGELNQSYLSDKGGNSKTSRNAIFEKKFRWFNTIFRFSENIDKCLLYGYSVGKFLSKEELDFYFLPQSLASEKLLGADSTKYNTLNDTISKRADKWVLTSLVSEWIEEFSKQMIGKSDPDVSKEMLKKREGKIAWMIDGKSDSATVVAIIGVDKYNIYKAEADTSTAIVNRRFEQLMSFKPYSVSFIMPGEVIGTNGFINKENELFWTVKADFFLSAPYQMWAESKVVNIWAWLVTGIFILFVITGLMIRLFRKKH